MPITQRTHYVALSFALSGLLIGCDEADPPESYSAVRSAAPGGAWSIEPSRDLNAFFDCLADADATIVSAHRGGPAPGYPENAIETFAATLNAAPALIEFDVATSADGVLYLMHDDTLDRTTTGAGDADALDFSLIEDLALVDNDGRPTAFSPPRFDAALAFLEGRSLAQIDFKRSTRFEDAIAEIRRQGAESRVILIAYTIAQARRLHRLAPEMMISLSVENEDEYQSALSAGLPANRLLAFTGTDSPRPRLNAILTDQDVEIIFGTLGGRNSIDSGAARDGDDQAYARIAAVGVDVIATDRPRAAHRALTDANLAPENGECGVSRRGRATTP